ADRGIVGVAAQSRVRQRQRTEVFDRAAPVSSGVVAAQRTARYDEGSGGIVLDPSAGAAAGTGREVAGQNAVGDRHRAEILNRSGAVTGRVCVERAVGDGRGAATVDRTA